MVYIIGFEVSIPELPSPPLLHKLENAMTFTLYGYDGNTRSRVVRIVVCKLANTKYKSMQD